MNPVFNNTQSVLGYLVGQTFDFQPLALNNPTAWSSSELPPGLSIDGVTGRISGAVTAPGVYVVAIQASNADGTASAVFTFGIEAAAASAGADVDIVIDVVTKEVTLAAAVPLASSVTAPTPDTEPTAICTAKYGDDLIFNIRLAKDGSTIAPTVTSATCTLKETADDQALVTSTTFQQIGTGDSTRYRILVPLTGDALQGAIADGDGAVQVRQEMIAEISLQYNNPTTGFGPSSLTLTSDNFGITLVGSLK